jgi:site-specific DNA-methyltransferase (adenine-specific)
MLDFGYYNMDCMEGMKEFPDKYFDLAIVDPPYGINIGAKVGGQSHLVKVGGGKIVASKTYRGVDDTQTTDKKYFEELKRVSVNQIIFGGNYFIEYLANTPCFIVWDKDNSGNFADCELAWTSFNTAVRKFKFRWNGMLQENMKDKEYRLHPTQKPVKLYEWLLTNYAKQGDKILDTHVGSASSLIACHNLGFQYVGFELDKEYYEQSLKRLETAKKQVSILDVIEKQENTQIGMEE